MNSRTFNSSNFEENISIQERLDLFRNRDLGYINPFVFYTSRFHSIPNFIEEERIKCEEAFKSFEELYKSEITDSFYSKRHIR